MTAAMEPQLKRTEVDLAGLMRVLGEALYSTPQVAIRELVQNAYDSGVRRRMESDFDGVNVIRVDCDPASATLTIGDSGAGLTAEEIERYLATVGRGYTRELRDANSDSALIGYFGLGFLSTFVIADATEVHTCSYQAPDKAWRFATRDGQRYSIRDAEPRPIGTEVKLQLKEAHRSLSDPRVLAAILRRYCALLPTEVTLGGKPVNATSPPWRLPADTHPVRLRKLALEWAELFEPVYKPLCTIAIDEPDVGLVGTIWVQDGGSYASSDSRHVSIFVRGMLISDDERDLLPAWAGFCGAVFESQALSPTASRESLQEGPELQRNKALIRRGLVEGLAKITKDQPDAWARVLTRHNDKLLGAALSEEALFDLVADSVTLPTSEGDLTLPQVLTRARGKLYVGTSDGGDFAELLFRALKVPVIDGARYAAGPFADEYALRRRGTVIRLGTSEGDSTLFRRTNLPAAEERLVASWFADLDAQVVIAEFEPQALPFVVVPDEDVLRKRRIEADEAQQRMDAGVLQMARMFTAQTVDTGAARLYVNMASPLMNDLLKAPAPLRDQVLGLLRPLTTLLAHSAAPAGDIETALASYCERLRALLDDGASE